VTWVTWRGFYVPGEVDQATYDRWVDVLSQVGRSPEWVEERRLNRLQPFFMMGDEFAAFVYAQVEDFREMSREIGLID
jgi:tripartite-type tricarboxylate transporter receptor subunit TctC